MLLVADSGASKTAWILSDNDGYPREFSTMGFTPMFHSEQDILIALGGNSGLSEWADRVSVVRYFGSGCSSEDRIAKVQNALQKFFPNAAVYVEHDLLGSVLATCGHASGISCILGTGSNACFYDGQTIHEEVPSLDYVLGDEGSGAYFGKKLITKFLYKQLPTDLHDAFYAQYHIDKETALNRVYRMPNAKTWLAGFSQFLREHLTHPYVANFIFEGIDEFVQTRILIFPNCRQVPVHFVGSIAFHFQTILQSVCEKHQLTIGKIIKEPIYELTDYIKSQEIKV